MKRRSTLISFWLPRFAFLIAVAILGWALINVRLLILQARVSAPAGRGVPPAEAPTSTPQAETLSSEESWIRSFDQNREFQIAMLDADDRPWGRWEEYLNEPGYRVKRIIVHPGKRLSLQKHQQRSEHWVIAEGEGTFTLDGETRQVFAGDVLFIPTGGIHRIENGDAKKLVIIETQLGLCLEEDIIRLEDDWGRA